MTLLEGRAKLLFFGTLILSLHLAGCGAGSEDSSRPKRVKVQGTVKYQGKPVEGAEVTFTNEAAGTTGFAKTDSSGHYQLSTFGSGDGAVPGAQTVTIRKVEVTSKADPNVDLTAGGNAPPPEVKWIVPEKYSNSLTSGLTANVTDAGPNTFDFDLK